MRTMLLFIALLMPGLTSAQSNFTRLNPPGPHTVGLRVVEQYDFSRGYRGATDPDTGKPTQGEERARPIQTMIWYPAQKRSGRKMSAGDYLRFGATGDAFGQTPVERARLEAAYLTERTFALSPKRARDELTATMTARRDALAEPGKFPVVIYAPGYAGDGYENADLCEYLASLGYVVIGSPSLGQRPGGMTIDLKGAEAQTGDIEYLIGYAHTLPQADTGRVGVIGYSWGGMANIMAAATDPRISALVAFDGSVRFFPGIVEQSRSVTPERITAPLLYVASAPREIENAPADANRETSFLNKMKYADLYRVTMAPYEHANFAVMLGQRFLADERYGDYDKDELSVANAWVETYVRRFLDAYLKGDRVGQAFLDTPASRKGAPAHLFTEFSRRAQGAPPTRAAFAAELARQGFDHASDVYKAFKKREPEFTLSDEDLNMWGYTLLRNGDTTAAVAILRLDAELYVDDPNAWDSLGEAYAKNGQNDLAIDAYRKSLALNPKNDNATKQIAILQARPHQ
ncbi:dienelactone hydrolase family protein [Rhodanobacter umsongensis]|uniref:Dienelactone hydrolase family protein n=1 Tax=Rhodanobacter umsongensis TaxID=633153 RepID=A0ABW0JNW7_9GAMM